MGKVNGLGGKIEKDETPEKCIAREVKEETGLVTNSKEWEWIGVLHSSIFETHTFFAVYEGNLEKIKMLTDEKPEWFDRNNLPPNIMINLSWLIPLCIDKKKNREIKSVEVHHNF